LSERNRPELRTVATMLREHPWLAIAHLVDG
jgi:hypothetical protein